MDVNKKMEPNYVSTFNGLNRHERRKAKAIARRNRKNTDIQRHAIKIKNKVAKRRSKARSR